MMGYIVNLRNVRFVERAELTMFNYGPHAVFSEFSAEFVPVIPHINSDGLTLAEVPVEDFPANRGIVGLCHLTMYA